MESMSSHSDEWTEKMSALIETKLEGQGGDSTGKLRLATGVLTDRRTTTYGDWNQLISLTDTTSRRYVLGSLRDSSRHIAISVASGLDSEGRTSGMITTFDIDLVEGSIEVGQGYPRGRQHAKQNYSLFGINDADSDTKKEAVFKLLETLGSSEISE